MQRWLITAGQATKRTVLYSELQAVNILVKGLLIPMLLKHYKDFVQPA